MGRERTAEEMMEVNLLRWNEKALANQTSRFYDLERFLEKKDSLLPIEIEEVGDVTGKDLLHLQCHLGLDTLSWAGRGAKATGVDFSPQAIRIARELSHRIDVQVKFIESDIYRMDSVLDREFDIVYTSYGVL
ncbi:MAG: class I SAM-dependent methyltransferase, partial [Methanomassiliicoccales archaeon]|nr:class I SAM-dependent methyltransferase [Methanomassiliicoccales archaeon]